MSFAQTWEAQRSGLSHVGPTPAASYAYADWWGPTLSPRECAELRACTGRPRNGPEAWRADNFDVFGEDLRPELVERVLEPFLVANQRWWQLDVDAWHLGLKRYGPGRRHDEHVDFGPARQNVKIAGTWQLSRPQDYTGGELTLRIAGAEIPAPAEQGAGVAFPAWTPHLVSPVLAGERWALVVMAAGPKPR